MTSEAVRRIAAEFGLKTADQVPPPAPKRPMAAPARTRDRRSPEWWKVFRDLTPAAVYISGHDVPVPRSLADNRGVWPIRIGITTRWEPLETLTKEMDRHHPVHWMGMWFRVWTLSGDDAGNLACHVASAIASYELVGTPNSPDHVADLQKEIVRWVRADKLRKGFVDIGSDFDLPTIDGEDIRRRLKMPAPADQEQHRTQYYEVIRNKLELAVHQLAGDHCIQAWDDEAFAAHIEVVAAKRAQRALGGRV